MPSRNKVPGAAGAVRGVCSARPWGWLEVHIADPPPHWVRHFARVVGFSALAIGFFLIFMIGLSLIR